MALLSAYHASVMFTICRDVAEKGIFDNIYICNLEAARKSSLEIRLPTLCCRIRTFLCSIISSYTAQVFIDAVAFLKNGFVVTITVLRDMIGKNETSMQNVINGLCCREMRELWLFFCKTGCYYQKPGGGLGNFPGINTPEVKFQRVNLLSLGNVRCQKSSSYE